MHIVRELEQPCTLRKTFVHAMCVITRPQIACALDGATMAQADRAENMMPLTRAWVVHRPVLDQLDLLSHVLFGRVTEQVQILYLQGERPFYDNPALNAVLFCIQWYDRCILARCLGIRLYVPDKTVQRVVEQVRLMYLNQGVTQRVLVSVVSELADVEETAARVHVYCDCQPFYFIRRCKPSVKTVVLQRRDALMFEDSPLCVDSTDFISGRVDFNRSCGLS